jgi:hypothetical protein
VEAAAEVEAPSFEQNLRQLLFKVHPDRFVGDDEDEARAANGASLQKLNSYIDDHRGRRPDGEAAPELPVFRAPVQAHFFLHRPAAEGGAGGAPPAAHERLVAVQLGLGRIVASEKSHRIC